MDSIRSMRSLVRAVELGSLSAVAREEGTSQPTVSKTIAGLERELGVRLLERTTTSLALTDQGRRFYERSKRVLEEYAEAVADAQGLTEKPAGFLRVNAPVGLGELRLNEIVLRFLDEYPDIDIELILNDRFVDLVEEGVDVAVRLGGALPPNVVARKVASAERIVVAAPGYLQGKPKLRRPEDLAKLNYIRFAWLASGAKLELIGPQGTTTITTRGRYRVNSSMAIRDSLRQGVGVGIAPTWLVQDLLDSGDLVRVLPKWRASPHELHLVYPSRRYQPLRARVFMQWLAQGLVQAPGFSAVGGG
jgi:DNA-binding transcriptional LysR family regulator